MQSAPVPSLAVLAKLGSIAVLLQEFASPYGQAIDLLQAESLSQSPDVQAFLKEMAAHALVPVRRRDR